MLRMFEQHWFEVISALISIAVSWGIITTKIKNQEKEIDEVKGEIAESRKDHDLIIRLDTKVDGITETLQEMRTIIETKRSKK